VAVIVYVTDCENVGIVVVFGKLIDVLIGGKFNVYVLNIDLNGVIYAAVCNFLIDFEPYICNYDAFIIQILY
jgi:hypothetical protein